MAIDFQNPSSEPIALIGIGCRYPQAGGAAALWRLLMQSGEAIHSYGERRFAEMDAFYAASAKRQTGIAVHRGGFLSSIDKFDAQFFELAPREAMFMDPQYRLLLEVTWEALEDSGQIRERYEGSRTGVFVGLSEGDYESHLYHAASELDFYMMSNGNRSSASGRISYTFGFEGPSMTIDTACSSSLVAIHLACQALKTGKIDMALAGGVHVMTAVHTTELFAQANMLARDGRCKFGDAAADGFVRSEGCGMVVLKRLSEAAAAGDPIYAILRGSAVNNDGRTNGLMMTPSSEGQQKMLRQAWADAGIDPRHLRYIEAHGTGTSVGDPIEIGAIGEALAAAEVKEPCLLGSIKTNIGHTEAASGVAGLIKAALALHHRALPPSLNLAHPNPKIAWERLPVEIVTQPKSLSAGEEPIFAGVNSFGLSGTNAHVVLEEFRPRPAMQRADDGGPYLFALSAHSQAALDARVAEFAAFLRDSHQTHSMRDICYTSGARRTHLEYRLAAVADSRDDLDAKLHAALERQASEGVATGRRQHERRRIVFVAPGQGSQWAGMARDLFRAEPVFRRALKRIDAAIQEEAGWSLIERVLGAAAAEHLLEIDVVQPALFAVSVALAKLWRFWGVEPNAVVGHSMGEVAAAHIGGVLDLRDAVSVICRRSRLMKTISGSGGMATIELPPEEIERCIGSAYENVSIAAINSPGTTVISGDPEEVDSLLNTLELKEVFCRRIKVDVASHSAQVNSILPALDRQLNHLRPKDAEIPIFSTVTGEYVSGGEMNAFYWVNNLRKPVLFAKAIDALAQDGHDVFIELSPHPILLPAIESTLSAARPDALLVASLKRDKPERASMLASAGSLFVAGLPISWPHIYEHPGRCVPLPNYPFQRERCWPDASMLLSGTNRTRSADRPNPLLGVRLESSLHPGATLWEADLDLSRFPYLKDHTVRGSVLLPGSAHVELAFEAAQSLCPDATFDIARLALSNAVHLSETEPQQFQIALLPAGDRSFSFEIRGRFQEGDGSWTLHSSGRLEPRKQTLPQPSVSFAEMQQGDARRHSAEDHYRAMDARGIHYGPAFRLFSEAWTRENGSLCRIQSVHESVHGADNYVVHPALLDACFQSFSELVPESSDTYLPIAIGQLSLYADIPQGEDVFVYVRPASEGSSEDVIHLDLQVMDGAETVLMEVRGLKAQRISNRLEDEIAGLLFDLEWKLDETAALTKQPAGTINEHWLIFADAYGVAEAFAETAAQRGGRCTLVRPGQTFRRIRSDADSAIRKFEADLSSPAAMEKLFQELGQEPPSAVIHMAAIYAGASRDYEYALPDGKQTSSGLEAAYVAQSIHKADWVDAPRLWLVTNGAFAIEPDEPVPALEASTIWGMGIVIAREQPELRTCLVDLSRNPDADEIECLAQMILSPEKEDRIALRKKTRYVARLIPSTRPAAGDIQEELRPEEEYRLETSAAGIFDNLALRAIRREKPGPGEVAIEVLATGLNFIDVAKALDIYPGLDPDAPVHFGVECAGRIAALGQGVTAFAIDEEVIAISAEPHANGAFTSYLIVPAAMVARKPRHLSIEEAAALPVAYMTAYYSLVQLAKIRVGEWVLIPSAAGGVGLAAIEIAQQAGARVIATASTPEKHDYLKKLGVHVLPSRSLAFAEQALAITEGRGVDIVLNSLAGEFITKSLEILAPFGRFIELGKRDIYDDRRIGLKAFRNNLSYHVVDVGAGITNWREEFSQLFHHCIRQIDEKKWRPLPVQSFAVTKPDEPFRFMTTGKHIGKIVIRMDRAVRVLARKEKQLFHADSTYLITGAFGGVGSAVAEWMADNGAGHLMLVSRRTASAETRDLMQRIEARGASATHAQLDITDEKEVSGLIDKIRANMPPLRGVMHAAAALDDALIRDLTPHRYARVMEAKAHGAWNLHTATADCPLDFFLLFSSAAAIFTQPGMGSYAAANAYLDALARYRRARGLAASSVNWGGWNEIGLAREAGTKRSLEDFEEQGIENFSKREGLACLREILERNAVQTIVFHFDAEKFSRFHAQSGIPRIFSTLTEETSGKLGAPMQPGIREALASAQSDSSRATILEAHLQEQLGNVLRCAPERIDRDRTLGTMGLDSLMALEFVRRLNAGLGVALPTTSVFNYPTIRLLARHILIKAGLSDDAKPATSDPHHEAAPRLQAKIAGELSDEEALRQLMYPGEAIDER